MTDLIAEAEKLLAQITSGEWVAENIAAEGNSAWGVVSGERCVVMHDFVSRPNAQFIAAAPRLVRQLIAALRESPEPWNPDLTTAPRDARIKLQLPPYVTGHLNTVVSVEPIAWAPDTD